MKIELHINGVTDPKQLEQRLVSAFHGTELAVGDVVRLKSGGGPKMTVQEVSGSRCVCRWWHFRCYADQEFAVASLERVARRQPYTPEPEDTGDALQPAGDTEEGGL